MMRSESTSALGQPSDTKPTFGTPLVLRASGTTLPPRASGTTLSPRAFAAGCFLVFVWVVIAGLLARARAVCIPFVRCQVSSQRRTRVWAMA